MRSLHHVKQKNRRRIKLEQFSFKAEKCILIGNATVREVKSFTFPFIFYQVLIDGKAQKTLM